MDNDNPDLNNVAHDNQEWWKAKKDEFEAKLQIMDAERRLAANDAFEDFGKEVEAAGDWTEAEWNQFKAKVSQWWNSIESKGDDAV